VLGLVEFHVFGAVSLKFGFIDFVENFVEQRFFRAVIPP